MSQPLNSKTSPIANCKAIDIKDFIPHRTPMLLVDEVLEVNPDKNIICRKKFAKNDPIFAGHFPEHPVLPGVMGIEALAQTGALLVNISLNKKAEETLFFFMSIESTKFRLPVFPDDSLELQVKMIKHRGNVYKFAGKALLKGKTAIEVTFTAKQEDIS